MGDWGAGAFENDAALDWIGDVEERGVEAVREALSKAADADEYLTMDDGRRAVAAAEVVAAVLGSPPSAPEPRDVVIEHVPMLADWAAGATEEVSVFARRMPELVEEAAVARRAVATVLDPGRSELYALWIGDEPPPPGHDWIEAVEGLRGRLGA